MDTKARLLTNELLNCFDDIIIVVNSCGVICYGNKAAQNYFSDYVDIEGKNVNLVFDKNKFTDKFIDHISSGLNFEKKYSCNYYEDINLSINAPIHWSFINNIDTKELQIIGKKKRFDQNQENVLRLFEGIQETMPGNFWWKDRDGVYRGSNKNVMQVFGLEPEYVVGKTDHELPWKSDADKLVENDNEVMNSGETRRYEEVLKGFDGEIHTFLVMKSPLKNTKGDIVGTVGTSFDITYRKKIERDLELAKQQEEDLRKAVMVLAGSIAHDLRTPLSTIGAIAYSSARDLPPVVKFYKEGDKKNIPFSEQILPPQLEWLSGTPQKLTNTVSEMHSFISDSLKALNTAITGIKSASDLIPCTSWKCLQNALQRYPFSADEKKLIQWDRSYEFKFMGNPILFYRIIFNLIKNALYQIHKNGQGEIFISSEQNEAFNLLKVKDTAGGVTDEIVQKIFNGFESSKEGGTGVGLAFCKLSMQNIGGDIECQRVDGDKIEFVLSFPKNKT